MSGADARTGEAASQRLTWPAAVAIAAMAVAARLVLSLVSMHSAEASMLDWASSADGGQYLQLASDMRFGACFVALDPGIGRFFPLTSAVLAGLNWTGLSAAWSGLGMSWLGAAVAAVLSATWAKRRWVGVYMAFATPIFLYSSALISSEVLSLTLLLMALLVGRARRPVLAGLLFGLAGLARPFAVFGAIAWAVERTRARASREAIVGAASALGAFAFGLALSSARFGDPWMSFRTYSNLHEGGVFAWPLEWLVRVSFGGEVAIWKLVYVWAHVLLGATAVVLATRARGRARAKGDASYFVAVVWWSAILLGTLSVGSSWGFHDLPRYLTVGLPAWIVLLDPLLPKRASWILVFGAVSLLLAFGPARRNLVVGVEDPFSPVARSRCGASGSSGARAADSLPMDGRARTPEEVRERR